MSGQEAETQSASAFGWAARDSSGILSPFAFSRRLNGDDDITIKILYCGVCHTDLHSVKNDFGVSNYPVVPGHEIVGVVTQVGKCVKNFQIGDRAGVGCLIGSCGNCHNCQNDLENYCPKPVYSYTMLAQSGPKNYGGFSNFYVVNEHFAIHIPDDLPLEGAAPLLCGGVTVFSPLKYFGLDKAGMHVGVVGLGGLGHLAVKFAKAFGAKVSVISTSPGKQKEAIELVKADSFIVSSDMKQMEAAFGTMDGIIDTVSPRHPLKPLLDLLKTGGKLIMLSAPDLGTPFEVPSWPLFERKLVSGSMSGGIKETQEMINFAANNNITANVEVISMDYINIAMDRLAKGDVRYRFVIDIGNTLQVQSDLSYSCC